MLIAPAVHAATFYVETSGSDASSRNGSSPASAWRTLGYACQRVSAANGGSGGGNTIQLGDGEFREVARVFPGGSSAELRQVVVPSNINILGKGSHRTVVRSNFRPDPLGYYSDGNIRTQENKFLLRTQNANNSLFRGFTIDGDGRAAWGGFLAQGNNLKFQNLRFSNFKFMGLWVSEKSIGSPAQNISVQYCAFADTALANSKTCFGNLNIGETQNGDFHNLFISEADKSYGIKHIRVNYPYTGTTSSPVNGNKYRDSTVFLGQKTGAWSGGQAANITLEFWRAVPNNVQIYNCSFNNNVSLAVYNPAAATNFDFHNNMVAAQGYAVESKTMNSRLHHNVFVGSEWGLGSTNLIENLTVDYNVFDRTGSVSQHLIRGRNGIRGLTFANNTVIANSSKPLFHVSGTSDANGNLNRNWTIKNNIFTHTTVSPASNTLFFYDSGTSVQNLALTGNQYYGIVKPAADTGTTANPAFSGTGDYPDPRLKATTAGTRGAINGSSGLSVGNKRHIVVFKSKTVPNAANLNSSIVSMNGSNGNYLTVNRLANSDPLTGWERFATYLNEDKTISLRATKGDGGAQYFVTVLADGRLQAGATAIGDAQKFAMKTNGDGTISFIARLNSKAVSVSGGSLNANGDASAIGDAQKFEAHTYSRPEDVISP